MKKYFKPVLCGIMIILSVIYSESSAESISNSINICLSEIIPSMFAMMVLSSYIISEGLYTVLFKPLYFIFGRFINMDKYTFSVFLLSLVGGYPVGVKLLSERISQNKNYSEIAEKAACFCYCISPTFAINIIGIGLYRSFEAGFIVYISDVISCIVIAVILGKRKTEETEYIKTAPSNHSLVNAVNSTTRTLFSVCTLLITWNLYICLAKKLLSSLGVNVSPWFTSIFEISNLLSLDKISISFLPAAAALSSFGGLCVISQCVIVSGGAFPIKRFLIFRLIGAAISAAVCFIIITFADISIPVSGGNITYTYSLSPQKGVYLLLICMAVLFFIKNEKIFKKG